MADRPSSTAAKIWKTFLKPFRGLVKRPKSANGAASSASGAHGSVPGKDAGSAQPTALGKYIASILVSSDSTSLQAATNSQPSVSDWKATANEGLGVGSRFTQTLLKKLPSCVDTNPVKMAFSIAKAIIEIKDVGHRLCVSSTV